MLVGWAVELECIVDGIAQIEVIHTNIAMHTRSRVGGGAPLLWTQRGCRGGDIHIHI